MKVSLLAFGVIGCMTCTFAQDNPASLDGKWLAEWSTPQGRPASADLDIKGVEGTWRQRVLGRTEDPCVKVAAPVQIERDGATLQLHILRSKVIGGCQDSRLTLTTGANGAPAGAWRDGREVRLTR